MVFHFRRMAITFTVVLAVYWVYALAAVPMIEPQAALVDGGNGPSPLPPSPPKQNRLLATLFASSDWERNNPKVLETEQGMLLFQDYQPLDDGRLEVKPFTLIFFSADNSADPSDGDNARAERPIIMQAPAGALLQFDSPINLARAAIGKLTKGRLLGEITIHSPPSREGADDGLEIVTHNAQFDEKLILAPNDVRFRMGRSFGSGRHLSIELSPPLAPATATDKQPRIGSLKLLELAHVDKVHLHLGGGDAVTRRFAADDTQLAPPSDEADDNDGAKPTTPLEITCQGPFQFDFEKSIATFERQVDVIRINAEGPSDQLNAELLEIHFGAREQAEAPAGSTPSALDPSSLDVQRLVAIGHPVVLRADSRGVTVRGRRMEYDVAADRYSLLDDERVLIETRQHSIRAAWAREIHVRPHQQNRVISMIGNAGVQLAGGGGFSADEVHVWLLEIPRQATAPPAKPAATKLVPDRMMALGNVQLDSPQLSGRTDRLEAWFRQPSPAGPLPSEVSSSGVSSSGASSGRASAGGVALPGSAVASPLTLSPEPADQPADFKIDVRGQLVRIQLADLGEGPVAEDVTVSGDVRVTQIDLAGSGEAPLVITGDVVQVRDGQSHSTTMKVVGRPAVVSARGMTLSGGNVQLDRAENRLWIDGPGEMTLPISQDLQGNPTDGPQAVTVSWQQAMDFDGQTAYFYGGVKALGENQLALAEQLEVTFSRRVDFTQPRQHDKPQLRHLAFDGGVYLESREIRQDRQHSVDQMQARNLSIDRISGNLYAEGPGWVNSVRRGADGFAGLGPTQPTSSNDSDDNNTGDNGLKYLHVEFQRQIVGNLHQREIQFSDEVKTIYGPVTAWEQTLDADRIDGLGQQGVSITCDTLTVTEMGPPTADGRRAVELEALGNTLVESRTFTARAERISYSEAKELLVLEGNGRTDAELIRHPRIGSRTARAAARRILYWRTTNRVEVDDASVLDLSNFGISTPQPAPPRR